MYYSTKERVRTHATAEVHVLFSGTLPLGGALHTLDKLMHFRPKLSDSVPLKNGFYSFRAQTDQYHHPVDRDSYTVVARGVADLYP